MWNLVDNGKTIGAPGSEGGEIVTDIEHTEGARLTLEQNKIHAPFSITSGIYGGFFHTSFYSNKQEAEADLEKMKNEVGGFFKLNLDQDQRYKWITEFVERH